MELVDKSELLSDYDGQGPSYDQLAHETENKSGSARQVSKLIRRSGKQVDVTQLTPSEKATIRVYSRSTAGAKITLLKDGDAVENVEPNSMDADSSEPYCTGLVSDLIGPGKLQVMAKSSNSSDCFLVHVAVFPLS